jgi:protein-tyrosine phosphatase
LSNYDDVIRLCREALDVLESKVAKPSEGEAASATNEEVKGGRGHADVEDFSSVAELVERVERNLSDYRALLEKYEDLADVEDLEFEDIVARVEALMEKLNRFMRRQV